MASSPRHFTILAALYFFSGTSEDPLAVVGVLSAIHRRPAIALVDEIRSGSYRGDARKFWKRLCRLGMRRAELNIVNDASRIDLLKEICEASERIKKLLFTPAHFVVRLLRSTGNYSGKPGVCPRTLWWWVRLATLISV